MIRWQVDLTGRVALLNVPHATCFVATDQALPFFTLVLCIRKIAEKVVLVRRKATAYGRSGFAGSALFVPAFTLICSFCPIQQAKLPSSQGTTK